MDNNKLILLSKFIVAARDHIGVVIPTRLLKDINYQKDVFDKVYATADADLLLVTLELQDSLGMLPESGVVNSDTIQKKYVFGARS